MAEKEQHFGEYFSVKHVFWFIKCNDPSQTPLTFTVIWMITTAQLCYLALGNDAAFSFDTGVGRVFFSVLRFVTEFPFTEDAAYAISTAAVGGFLAYALACALTTYYWQWSAPLWLQGRLLTWLPTAFFVPVFLPHAQMLVPCMRHHAHAHIVAPHYPALTCWDDKHSALSALSLIVLAVWLPLCYLANLICYNADLPTKPQCRDNALDARLNNRPEAYMVLVKAVLFTLFVADVDASWRYAHSVLLALAGTAMMACQLHYLPWWRDEAQALYVAQAALAGWSGVAALIVAAAHDRAGAVTLYFLGMPVVGLLAAVALRWRLQSLNERAAHELDSAWLFQLKARNTLRGHQAYLRTLGDVYVEDTPALEQRRRELLSVLVHTYEMGLMRFPTDAGLHASVATFHAYVDRNRALAYRAIHTAEQLHPSLDCAYQLYRAREALREAVHDEACSGEVAAYLEFNAREPLAREATAQATRALVQFWNELLRERPDVDQVSAVGQTAREELSKAVAHYERLLVLNPRSKATLRAYALLCTEITGEHSAAVQLLQRAEEAEVAERGSRAELEERDITFGQFLREVSVRMSVFDEVNGIVSVSVAPESLGLITAANPALARTLGYHKASDLVGRNVSVLLPEPIAQTHDQLLTTYLTSKRSHVMNRVRMVMAVHHQGHMCPFFMHLRWEDEARGRMIAVMQPFQNKREMCAIVDADTHVVAYATQNIVDLFGFSRRDVLSRRVKLAAVAPALAAEDGEHTERALAELLGEGGHKYITAHQLSGDYLHVHAHMQYHIVLDQAFYFLRCTATALEHADADAMEGVWVPALAARDSPRARADASRMHTAVAYIAPAPAAVKRSTVRRHSSATVPPVSPRPSTQSAPPPVRAVAMAGDASAGARESKAECLSGRPPLTGRRLSLPLSVASSRGGDSMYTQFEANYSAEVVFYAATEADAGAHDPESPRSAMAGEDVDAEERGCAASVVEDTGSVVTERTDKTVATDVPVPVGPDTAAHDLKSRRRRCDVRTRRQLLLAISNDATTTRRKLVWMRVFAALMVVFVSALATVMFMVGADEIAQLVRSVEQMSQASLREAYMSEALFQFRFLQMITRLDPPPQMLAYFFRPEAMADMSKASILSGTHVLVERALTSLHALTALDRGGEKSAALRHLLRGESLELWAMVDGGVGTVRTSLLDAMARFSAYMRHSLFMDYDDDAEDPGFFFALANGLQRLREGLQRNTTLLQEQLREQRQRLEVFTVAMFAVSLACVVVVSVCLVMPLIARVEHSSDRVLAIFLDIPPRTRRALRRRAHRVYAVARKDDELLRSVPRDEEDEGGEGVDGEEAQSRGPELGPALEPTSPADAMSTDRQSARLVRADAVARYSRTHAAIGGEPGEDGASTAAAWDVGEDTVPGHMSLRVAPLGDGPDTTSKHCSGTALLTHTQHAGMGGRVVASGHRLLCRRSVHNLTVRFLAYLACVAAYYAALLVYTRAKGTHAEALALTSLVADRQAPAIQLAFFFSTQHVLANQTEALQYTPFDGAAYAGDYQQSGLANLYQADLATSIAQFGSATHGIPRVAHSDELVQLLHENVCALDPARADTLVDGFLAHYGYIFENCEGHFQGLFTKGLSHAVTYVIDGIRAVLTVPSKAVSHLFTGGAPGDGLPLVVLVQLMSQWALANNLYHDYVAPLLRLASVLYKEQVIDTYRDYDVMAAQLFCVFLAVNALAYAALFHRAAHVLASASTKTKNVMLLLPPEMIRYSAAAQAYVKEHISSI